ncbi:uncharacterized protein LOC134831150 isoform X2 [Culicoides brevitarsis]|uniref:uncharacterized protein LOC134831150 isoform X2 n=1 Tax=Culicoides brevitarsis TaxID=469753 RepID=UPI00307B28AA
MFLTFRAYRSGSIGPRVQVMSLEEARRTQRPYRYGMILLCLGALVNWLGLAENYSEPVRYAGVACILMGGLLICTAMCCWLHTPSRASVSDADQINANNNNNNNEDQNVHIIAINDRLRCEKPPDYEAVTMEPPSYDDAIKLDPSALLPLSKATLTNDTIFLINTTTAPINALETVRPSSSLYTTPEAAVICIENVCEHTCDSSNTANEKKIDAKSLPSTHDVSR